MIYDCSTVNIPSRVKNAVLSVDPEASVLLFGSRARGTAHEASDWDFFIVTHRRDKREFEDQLLAVLYPIMSETDELIQFIQFSATDWWAGKTPSFLVDNVRKEGIEL